MVYRDMYVHDYHVMLWMVWTRGCALVPLALAIHWAHPMDIISFSMVRPRLAAMLHPGQQ